MGDCCNVRLLKVLVVFFGVTSLALAITVMVLALTRVTFTSPRHSANYAGVNRTLVQFDDVRQYFGVHDCSAYTSCSGCVCLQENSLHTAVVWKHGETDPDDIEDTETDFFFFDGCCKCVNV